MTIARRGMIAMTAVLVGQMAVADPAADLRCLEAEWQAAAQVLQERRAEVWAWLDDWLLDSTQVGQCRRSWAYADRYGGNAGDTFAWRCDGAAGRVDTVLSFQAPDRERLMWLDILGIARGLEETKISSELEAALENLAKSFVVIGVAIATEGEVMLDADDVVLPEPEQPARIDPPETEQLDLALALPVQNRSGLTDISGGQAGAGGIPPVADIQRRYAMLRAFDADMAADGISQRAVATAHAGVVDVISRQVDVWAGELTTFRVANFRPFGAEVAAVHTGATYMSVYDIGSWSTTKQEDGVMIEGVNEIVFYFDPQSDFALSLSVEQDCKITKSFPCPPLNGGARAAAHEVTVPSGCHTAQGCEFSTPRWVNDHVAVRAHVRARNVDPARMSRFMGNMTTFRTREVLAGLAPDPRFDPSAHCAP